MTSGAIQNGVPTDELRRIKMFDNSAETPNIKEKIKKLFNINKDCLNLLLKSINIKLYLFCHFFMAVVFFLGSFKD